MALEGFNRYHVTTELVMNGICEEVVEAQVRELLRTNPATFVALITSIHAKKIDMSLGGVDLAPILLNNEKVDLESDPVEITFTLPKGSLMTALALLGMQLENIRVDEEGQAKGNEIQFDWTAEQHVLEIMVYALADKAKEHNLLEADEDGGEDQEHA